MQAFAFATSNRKCEASVLGSLTLLAQLCCAMQADRELPGLSRDTFSYGIFPFRVEVSKKATVEVSVPVVLAKGVMTLQCANDFGVITTHVRNVSVRRVPKHALIRLVRHGDERFAIEPVLRTCSVQPLARRRDLRLDRRGRLGGKARRNGLPSTAANHQRSAVVQFSDERQRSNVHHEYNSGANDARSASVCESETRRLRWWRSCLVHVVGRSEKHIALGRYSWCTHLVHDFFS